MDKGLGYKATAADGRERLRPDHQQIGFEELKRAIRQIEDRIRTLDLAIEDAVKPWRFAPVVDALRALRGVNTMTGETSGGYLSSRRELTITDISAAACVRMKRPVNSRMGGCRNAMFKSKRVKATG